MPATAKGNDAADQAAKKAAGYHNKMMTVRAEQGTRLQVNLESIGKLQAQASPQERTMCMARGAVEKDVRNM